MNDPVEEILSRLTPRGAPPELRGDTLAATRDTLLARPPRRWDLWCGIAAAASLLLGIGLNFWVLRADEARFAELDGPRPLPRQLAEAADLIESVTDPETGRWVRDQWRVAQASRHLSSEGAVDRIRHHYQTILNEIAVARKEPSHVEKDPQDRQVDRDRRDEPGGDTTRHFRGSHLRHEFTA